MKLPLRRHNRLALALYLALAACGETVATEPRAPISPQIHVDRGHPWRSPFGLDRVGAPPEVLVQWPEGDPVPPGLVAAGLVNGTQIFRLPVVLSGTPPTGRVKLDLWPMEMVLLTESPGQSVELARVAVEPPPFEAEAVANPASRIHPVDLGTILVPSGWLLLGDGQQAFLEAAALSRAFDHRNSIALAWFESAPGAKTSIPMSLAKGCRAQARWPLPPASTTLDCDTLHVSIQNANGSELWHKTIPTMLVHRPPQWPRFGASALKLRYDAPISVRAADGELSSINYDDAWDAELDDVVVALPNGARFVFWRGSSYVPFWAGRCNTGLSYEWAETSPPADGFDDCVEPLMDKELRYGRVEIVESTPSRVHARWSYQSCDFQYKVWGDTAVEDYYFYPDGFGTRVLTIQRAATSDYELSEFIILTPQATYPFSVLPANLVDVLFLDGEKRQLHFPFFPQEQGEKAESRGIPAVYRVRLHKDEPLAAVYFHPEHTELPPAIFAPFSDQGVVVTPTYWGSHWPLARGKTTGWSIDDRVHLTPCHNSVMSWARSRPTPLWSLQRETLDSLGRLRPMIVERWAWLIGMTDSDDGRLLQWAQSFAQPPLIEVEGARLESEPDAFQRRAIWLTAESDTVTMRVKPAPVCVNPVFELSNAPGVIRRVELAGQPLAAEQYAWDGRTLWLDATLSQPQVLRLEFGSAHEGEGR